MKHDPKSMSCQEFQEQLPELIGAGADLENHPHLQSCELCRALLSDLETIAEAARQLFPIQQPEDGLWDRIESAIKEDEAGLSKAE
jgi:predicted anti-sigma-YlaC factor YlaD